MKTKVELEKPHVHKTYVSVTQQWSKFVPYIPAIVSFMVPIHAPTLENYPLCTNSFVIRRRMYLYCITNH